MGSVVAFEDDVFGIDAKAGQGVTYAGDQPEVLAGVALLIGVEPLQEAAHGRDAGAGGNEDGIVQRLAQSEVSVGTVELHFTALLQVAEEIREVAVGDAIKAEIELASA